MKRWWCDQRNGGERIGEVLRRAFDEVLDGQRTGRYRIEELRNSEKTYIGTKVEILLADEFYIPRPLGRGGRLDFVIDGIDVDCKFSLRSSWMIPPEAVGKLCILVSASDATALFSFGLLRCEACLLNASNRDQKRSISAAGRARVVWLWRDEQMPPNLLRGLPPRVLQDIFAQPGRGSGQARVNELFRRVQGTIIRRAVIFTVAQQEDSMKRARDARRDLQAEGILVLGHQNDHPRIARDLGIPVPQKGEFVSIRVVPFTQALQLQGRPIVDINGARWVKAMPSDQTCPGPKSY